MGAGVPFLAVFFTGTWVPSLAVFLSSRPCGTWLFHQTFCTPPVCFIVASGEPSVQSCGGCSVLRCFRGFLRVHLPIPVPHLSSSAATALFITSLYVRSSAFFSLACCHVSLAPILVFGSRMTSALVCYFSPESPSSTSSYFRASAPCAARSIALARRKTTARVSSSFLFTTCSYGCGSVTFAFPPAPSWGSLQRRGLPAVSPALLCSTPPRVVAGPVPPCGSVPQRGQLFLRTGLCCVSFSLLHVLSVSHAATLASHVAFTRYFST